MAGKTQRMLRQALELASDGDVVIVVHSSKFAENLQAKMRDLDWMTYGTFSRSRRVKFATREEQLRGMPIRYLLADHHWIETMQWVVDVLRKREPDA